MPNPEPQKGLAFQITAVLMILIGIGILASYRELGGGVIYPIIAFGLFSAGGSLFKNGKRLKQPIAEELLSADDRPHILFLRSFEQDEKTISTPFRWSQVVMFHPDYYLTRASTTFEEQLISILGNRAPVVALGRPDELMQPLGASRSYVDNSNWKARFMDLAKEAELFIFMIENTASLKWELSWLKANKEMSKIFILLPPLEWLSKDTKWIESWSELQNEFSFLPDYEDNSVAIKFLDDGTPILVRAQNSKIGSQLKAIEAEF